ncbi:gluconolaconase [Luteimonas sp. RIT-PG2_3]
MRRAAWGVAILTALALGATFLPGSFLDPVRDALQVDKGPPATPLDWQARVQLLGGDGIRGDRDGRLLQARFADPWGLARAADGTLYIADAGDNNRIRRIGADGLATTFAGSVEGFVDGTGTAAAFDTPSGLAIDLAGNVYVADTGNHAIRRITPQGVVSTLAGTGIAGFRDGSGAQAQFNGPVGVAVDALGQVYVADTYNDRIRVIRSDGQVETLAGGERPGKADGWGTLARFDTPTGIAVNADGALWVADTGNHALRWISAQGEVRSWQPTTPEAFQTGLSRPLAVAVTHDGVLYVGEQGQGRVLQVTADGHARALTGTTMRQRFARPAALLVEDGGSVLVADADGFRLHRIEPLPVATTASANRASSPQATPAPTVAPLEDGPIGPSPEHPLPQTAQRWPLQPQDGWHEVVGTLGEVRGNFSGESRSHLHNGLDIRGDVGQTVLAIADGKVSSPYAAWSYGGQAEGLAIDELSYIHMRVGRTAQGRSLDPQRFQSLLDDAGQPERIRVPRGTRFVVGDALGTINAQAHVHLVVGASGYQHNAIKLGFTGFSDRFAPRIDAIRLLDASDQPLGERSDGRLLVPRDIGGLQIVVEAWDQVDDNLPRRRLGLHALGYQILDAAGTPLPGFEQPRMTLRFDRMPAHPDAVKVAYAADSGITVHGAARTRFQYVVSNTVQGLDLAVEHWQPGELPAGDYRIRITARDFSGNEAGANRELLLRLL